MFVPWLKFILFYTVCAVTLILQGRLKVWQALVLWNAATGVTAVELTFRNLPRFLHPNKELDREFPAFARLDVHHWSRWKCYPVAMTLMVPKMLLGMGGMLALAIYLQILVSFFGIEYGSKPITGWKLKAIHFGYFLSTTLAQAMSGYYTVKSFSDFDYSEYLGKDYKETQRLPKKASMVIANHQSWLDSPVLISAFFPGFTTSAEAGRIPVLSTLINCLQSVYVKRSGTLDEKKD
jgi:hypothetical protein